MIKTIKKRNSTQKRIYFDTYIEVVKFNGSYKIDLEDECFIDNHDWCITKTYKKSNSTCVCHMGKRLHRFIIKAQRGQIVDHINGDTLDNRKLNLRIVNNSQNCMNRKTSSIKRTSIYKGIYPRKNSKRWIVIIQANGKRMNFSAKTEKEAALKYNELALKYHGEFARLNVIK